MTTADFVPPISIQRMSFGNAYFLTGAACNKPCKEAGIRGSRNSRQQEFAAAGIRGSRNSRQQELAAAGTRGSRSEGINSSRWITSFG